MDRPIIFSAPMVRALLAGMKTQTRRLATSPLRRCKVGDRLWVREAWSGTFWSIDDIDGRAREYWETPKAERTKQFSAGVFYRLSEEEQPHGERFVPEGQWTPSIHMPRWASRLTLIVEAVRVEPLQAISETDAKAEGIIEYEPTEEDPAEFSYVDGGLIWNNARSAYEALWRHLHGADSWDANPEVVAISFSVVPGNIDRSEG
jgi:hypothetical protein